MSTEQHPMETLYIGDVWKIYGTMYDDEGNLVDLTGREADIEWALVDEKTNTRVVNGADVTITLIDPEQGDFLITVDDDKTSTVQPGRYTDVCRLLEPDGPRTKWTGQMHVARGM